MWDNTFPLRLILANVWEGVGKAVSTLTVEHAKSPESAMAAARSANIATGVHTQ